MQSQEKESTLCIQQSELNQVQISLREQQELVRTMKKNESVEKGKLTILSKEHEKIKAKLESTINYLRIQIKSTAHQRDEILQSMHGMKSVYEQYLLDKSVQDSLVIELQGQNTALFFQTLTHECTLKQQIDEAAIVEQKLKKANLSLQHHWNDCKMLLENTKTAKNLLTGRLFETSLQVSKVEAALEKEIKERNKDKKRLETAREYIISLRSQVSYLNSSWSELLSTNEHQDDCDERLCTDIELMDQQLRRQLLDATWSTNSYAHHSHSSSNSHGSSKTHCVSVGDIDIAIATEVTKRVYRSSRDIAVNTIISTLSLQLPSLSTASLSRSSPVLNITATKNNRSNLSLDSYYNNSTSVNNPNSNPNDPNSTSPVIMIDTNTTNTSHSHMVRDQNVENCISNKDGTEDSQLSLEAILVEALSFQKQIRNKTNSEMNSTSIPNVPSNAALLTYHQNNKSDSKKQKKTVVGKSSNYSSTSSCVNKKVALVNSNRKSCSSFSRSFFPGLDPGHSASFPSLYPRYS